MGYQTTKLKHILGSTGCKSIYSIMVCEILLVMRILIWRTEVLEKNLLLGLEKGGAQRLFQAFRLGGVTPTLLQGRAVPTNCAEPLCTGRPVVSSMFLGV